MGRGAEAADLLESPVRRDIIDVLTRLPVASMDPNQPTRSDGLTAAELAARLELHVTTIRFHVDRMTEAGMLSARDERVGVGRPRRHYVLARGVRPTRHVSMIAVEVLADALLDGLAEGETPTPEQAAQRWFERHVDEILPDNVSREPAATQGQLLSKIGLLMDLFQGWGYAPEIHTSEEGVLAEIDLTVCPLRSLVNHNTTVACGVHRGLVKATLDAIGESPSVALTPHAAPGRCLSRLRWLEETTKK